MNASVEKVKMSEAEALEAIANIEPQVATYSSLWLSVTFAYLTVAYLVGKRMTYFQCFATSLLYGVISTLFSVGVLAHGKAFFIVLSESDTPYSQIPIFADGELFWMLFIGGFFSFAALLSFYFMYDVRNGRKTKSST